MTEERRLHYEKRKLFSSSSIQSLFGECVVTVIPRAVLEVSKGLCAHYGLWRSTYRDSIDSVGYTLPSDEFYDTLDAEISSFLGGETMNCNELLLSLKNLASIAGGGGCGCGSGGLGSEDPPKSTVPVSPGNPPTGFDNWEQYQDYKCNWATKIVDSHISDVGWLKVTDLLLLTAQGAAIAFVTPLPGARLVALVALLTGIVVALGLGASVLSVLEGALISAREDLICKLFLATSPQEAESEYLGSLDSAIDGETGDSVIGNLAKQIGRYMSTNWGVNGLFEKRDVPLPAGDCSQCVQSPVAGIEALVQGVDSQFEAKAWITSVGGARWRVEAPAVQNLDICGVNGTYINYRAQGNVCFVMSNLQYVSGWAKTGAGCGNVNAQQCTPGNPQYGPVEFSSAEDSLAWLDGKTQVGHYLIHAGSGTFVYEFDAYLV